MSLHFLKRFVGVSVLSFTLILIFFSETCRAGAPYEVKEITNIVYKTVGDQEVKLSLFLPMENGEILTKRPTLIWLDSGCWFSKEPGRGGAWGWMDLAEKGFAVASVSHRSLEIVKFPCQMEDVRAAVRFLRANAEIYGLDPERFASMGASSGGHLSLCLGIPDGVSPFDVGENLDQSSQVQAVVDFYGPSWFPSYLNEYAPMPVNCLHRALGFDLDKPLEEQTDAFLEKAQIYSPRNYVSEKFAPTLIFQGGLDMVVPLSQSVSIYEALFRAHVRTHLWIGNEGVHDINSLFPVEETSGHIIDFLKEVGFEDEKTAL